MAKCSLTSSEELLGFSTIHDNICIYFSKARI